MLDHEVVRDLKKALQRAHVRNKNVKKQLMRSQQSQQRAIDIIASLRKDSDATNKRLSSILLRKLAETRLKNVYKQKYYIHVAALPSRRLMLAKCGRS